MGWISCSKKILQTSLRYDKEPLTLWKGCENVHIYVPILSVQCTEVRFASFLSGGFTTMAVINPPDWKVANRTFVQCTETCFGHESMKKQQS